MAKHQNSLIEHASWIDGCNVDEIGWQLNCYTD